MNRIFETYWGRAVALLVAVLICAGIYSLEFFVNGRSFLEKYPPDWSMFALLKALLLVGASWLIFWGLYA